MNRAMLVKHLAQAERHVADGRETISRQKGAISRLEASGQGESETANLARQLLHSMEQGVVQRIADRDHLEREWLTARGA